MPSIGPHEIVYIETTCKYIKYCHCKKIKDSTLLHTLFAFGLKTGGSSDDVVMRVLADTIY